MYVEPHWCRPVEFCPTCRKHVSYCGGHPVCPPVIAKPSLPKQMSLFPSSVHTYSLQTRQDDVQELLEKERWNEE